MERKHYIDNLRAFTTLMLFPYHIFMIYNNWGENWYIHGQALLIPSIWNQISAFWMMPLLFAIAGMSSRYALEKRSGGEYAKERVSKLLVPLIFGMLLVVPIQSYLAGIYFNGQASYFDYFTKFTDLSGYDGGWTTGHLWFILFLFVISMISLPFMLWYKNKGKGTLGSKVPLIPVILMGFLPCIASALKIGGKSPTEDLTYFLIGYFFLTNDDLLKRLDKYRFLLLGLFVLDAARTAFITHGEFYEMTSWLAILAILGLGRHYLNFSGKITKYLSKSSFGIYVFHQSWIVVAASFIFKLTDHLILQIPLIFLSAIVLTFLTYEICRRTPGLRWMFGLKK